MQNEITELRNQVRTLKRVVYGFGCLLVAGVVVNATSLETVPDVIQAKSFEVVNDEGKEVAILSEYDGWGVLVICNKNGEPVARLRAANYLPHDGAPETGGGLLNIYNKDFKVVVRIGVDADGNGVVQTQNGKDEEISVEPSEE